MVLDAALPVLVLLEARADLAVEEHPDEEVAVEGPGEDEPSEGGVVGRRVARGEVRAHQAQVLVLLGVAQQEVLVEAEGHEGAPDEGAEVEEGHGREEAGDEHDDAAHHQEGRHGVDAGPVREADGARHHEGEPHHAVGQEEEGEGEGAVRDGEQAALAKHRVNPRSNFPISPRQLIVLHILQKNISCEIQIQIFFSVYLRGRGVAK